MLEARLTKWTRLCACSSKQWLGACRSRHDCSDQVQGDTRDSVEQREQSYVGGESQRWVIRDKAKKGYAIQKKIAYEACCRKATSCFGLAVCDAGECCRHVHKTPAEKVIFRPHTRPQFKTQREGKSRWGACKKQAQTRHLNEQTERHIPHAPYLVTGRHVR